MTAPANSINNKLTTNISAFVPSLVGEAANVTESSNSDIRHLEPCNRDYYGIWVPERNNCVANFTSGFNISLNCYPHGMDSESKFGYTLFFILVPWPFFIYEFFTSRHYEALVAQGAKIIEEMAQCSGLKSVLKCYIREAVNTLV